VANLKIQVIIYPFFYLTYQGNLTIRSIPMLTESLNF